MNTANKITLFRIVLIPVFLVCYLWDGIPHGVAAVIFAIAAISDAVDGQIARGHNQVTTFGKFADPLADKLLVSAALLGMIEQLAIPSWLVFVILAREFVVTGMRLVAVTEGTVLAAGIVGKVKTVIQLVVIILLLLWDFSFPVGGIRLCDWMMGLVAAITLYSGGVYLKQNWKLMKMK